MRLADDRKKQILGISIALGIIVTYSLNGIAVENIFKKYYDGEKFTFAVAFAALQCILPLLVAKGKKVFFYSFLI